MNWIRERVVRRELVVGTWLNLGSSLVAEIAGGPGSIGWCWTSNTERGIRRAWCTNSRPFPAAPPRPRPGGLERGAPRETRSLTWARPA